MSSAGLKTVGLKTAMCDFNDIKKARYTVQVMSPVLYTLLQEAYKESSEEICFDEWARTKEDPTFKYWYGILGHEKDILLLVRSIREANFTLFIASLENICPLLFSLDHVHYSRWLPVFVHDIKMLKITDPELFKQFTSGFFAVMKSNSQFCKKAFDQCHEQNNKIIKSKSGYVDLLNKEDTDFLEKLELSFPEIQEYLHAKENGQSTKQRAHKEAASSYIAKYINDCKSVYSKFTVNPFLDSQLQKINTTLIFPDAIVNDVEKVFTLGKTQYSEYVRTRFVLGSEDVIKTAIPKNNLKLPSDAANVQKESPQIKLSPAILVKLRNACGNRVSLAKELFKTEFTGGR